MIPKNQNNQKTDIIRNVFPYWATSVVVISLIFFFIGDIRGVYSTILGSVVSLLGLRQLAEDQYVILMQKNRKRVFISFLFRLGLYAIPIIISLKYVNYFKFWVILICLFKSQVIFIIQELIFNYKSYKQRMDKDG